MAPEPLMLSLKKKISNAMKRLLHDEAYLKQKKITSIEQTLRAFDNLTALEIETKSRIQDQITDSVSEFFCADFVFNKYLDKSLLVTTLSLFIALVIFYSAIYSSFPSNEQAYFLLPTTMFALAILISLLLCIRKLYDFFLRRNHTISYLLNVLIALIVYEESNPNNLMDLNRKKYLLEQLEDAAKCIEHYFPRQLRSGDNATDVWVRKTMKQVATAVRERKKWVLTPKRDTRDYFVKSLADMLVCIVEGNWDALIRKEEAELSPSLIRHYFAKAFRKTAQIFFYILVTTIIFYVIQLIPSIPQQIKNNFAPYLFLDITIILGALNPGFSTTISNANDFRNLW